MYIYLERKNGTGDPQFIDIRKENVEDFINETK